jgi:hypothetical protein
MSDNKKKARKETEIKISAYRISKAVAVKN